jgi:hypothetical protein
MRWPTRAMLQLIGKGPNQQQAPAAAVALPARWVELINYLNNVESRERDVSQAELGRHLRNASPP